MKKWIKWSIAGFLWTCVGASVIGLAVGCTTNINGTVITTNNNGISITHEQTLSEAGPYKLSTTISGVQTTTINNKTNTLNLPSSVKYNNDKTCPCIISLITENQTFNAISCVKWNNTTKSWDVYSNNKVLWSQVNESGTTKFTFNLSLVDAPANTFTNTSYYFCVELDNL